MKRIKLNDLFIVLDGFNDKYMIREYDDKLILVSEYVDE